MCVCFICINDNPGLFPFRLCLASNRDESFNRPALRLERWPAPENNIIGGRDITPGKENGTWLAVNSDTGKIGLLLNVRDRNFQPNTGGAKLARGNLIKDFLRSPLSAEIFTENLLKKGEQYEPFLLLMLQPNDTTGSYEGHFLTNLDSQHKIFKAESGGKCFGFSNSHPDKPLLKVSKGLQLFEEILQPYKESNRLSMDPPDGSQSAQKPEELSPKTDDIDCIQEMTVALFDLLSLPEHHFPDSMMKSIFPPDFPEDFLLRLSSINVNAHEKAYGTRTQTLLFINFDGKAVMLEHDIVPDSFRQRDGTLAGVTDRLIRLDFKVNK